MNNSYRIEQLKAFNNKFKSFLSLMVYEISSDQLNDNYIDFDDSCQFVESFELYRAINVIDSFLQNSESSNLTIDELYYLANKVNSSILDGQNLTDVSKNDELGYIKDDNYKLLDFSSIKMEVIVESSSSDITLPINGNNVVVDVSASLFGGNTSITLNQAIADIYSRFNTISSTDNGDLG